MNARYAFKDRYEGQSGHRIGRIGAMDGGYVREQEDEEHQVVFFTFSGKLSASELKEWNDAVKTLKKSYHSNLVAVTIKGQAPLRKRKARQRRR